jgi:hypothetical protein
VGKSPRVDPKITKTDLLREIDMLEARNTEMRQEIRDLRASVEAFETGLRTGVIAYVRQPDPRLQASPTSPRTMIGRQPPSLQSTESEAS